MRGTNGALAGRGRLIYGMSAAALLLAGLLITAKTGFLANLGRPTAATVGAFAPDFTLAKVGEKGELGLAELRGKPVVLNFFCGCGDCHRVAAEWGRRAKEIEGAYMVAVVHDSSAYNPAYVKNFRWSTSFQWPIVADVGSKVSLRWKSVNCPIAWVIDADGILRYQSPGRGTEAETIVDGTIKALKPVLGSRKA